MRDGNRWTVDGERWAVAADIRPRLNSSFDFRRRCRPPTSLRSVPADRRLPRCCRLPAADCRLPRGFTLVELLVVIVIIGILMGLVVGAAAMVKSTARRTGIGVEIANLDKALKDYRTQFGEYPPDCTDLSPYTTTTVGAVFMRHLNRAFPRFIVPGATPQAQFSWLNTNFYSVSGLYLSNLDASTAMVFFLAGWPSNQAYATNFSNQQLVYFSSDPTDPLDIFSSNYGKSPANIPTSRMQPLFQFDPMRLQQSNPGYASWWQFYPNIGSNPGSTGNCPYVYFRATPNGYNPGSNQYPGAGTRVQGYYDNFSNSPPGTPYVSQRWPSSYAAGPIGGITADVVTPYFQVNAALQLFQWYKPNDFQIICAGLDNHFGSRYTLPLDESFYTLTLTSSNGTNAVSYSFDNQTNFSTPTLEKTQ